MKKLILFLSISLAAIFIFSSCATPQSKAERNVQKYVKKSLENPNSYESISFGTLTEAHVSDDPEFKLVQDSIRFYRDSLNSAAGDQAAIAGIQKLMKQFEGKSKYLEQSYQMRAFKIDHKYKIDSQEKEQVFFFDEMLHVID